ncbi:hypothetical protein GCM10009578_070730 [Streptomyces rhizosphaericus]|uniref:AMP-dependent synthetase/ligase domain-containing protein n=1 Tax=Streptomyces rhizosphaericus TaxID=114699 RepID=A0ABN1RIF1_9ACTN
MNITQALRRAVQQAPNLPATVFGERSRTWRESVDRVARFAAALRDLGVAAGDRVGVLALNSDRFFEYLFAVPWADAVLNPINVRWSVQEIAFALDDSGTQTVLVDDTFAGLVPELRVACPGLVTIIHCGDDQLPQGTLSYEELVAANAPIPDAHRAGDAWAGIFYTGGSTGRAKGVMLSHTNIVTSALGSIASGVFMEPGGRLLHAAPMFHLADLAGWIARSILGGTHVILPSFVPATALAAIERHRVTEMLLVPTLVQALVDEPAAAKTDLSSLRHVMYGGGAITEVVIDRAATVLPGCEFTQA